MNTQQYRLTSEEFIAAIEQCAEQGDTFIRLNIVEAMPQSKNELEKIKRALDKMSNFTVSASTLLSIHTLALVKNPMFIFSMTVNILA